MCGQLTPQSGYVRPGAKVTIGYYDQTQEGLDFRMTAMQQLWNAYPQMTETQIRSAMAAFLFRGDEVYKTVGVMSGGERARLLLLKLMLAGDNLLLLDEPTNHLDIASREALEDALSGYDGTILAVSHDRYFINRMATRVLELDTDGITPAGNDYDAYAAAKARAAAAQAQESAAAEAAAPPPRENDYKQRKDRQAQVRRLRAAVRRAEEQIAALEAAAADLRARMADPAVAADYAQIAALGEELADNERRTEDTMEQWAQDQQTLEELGE